MDFPSHAQVTGFTTSMRTARGRVFVCVPPQVLAKLGVRKDDEALGVLKEQMPRLLAVALRRSEREQTNEVVLRNEDLWWLS
jgi:hypothetical protein